ncbi:MAG: 50S ribosomal protein L24 [Kiritimatiellae bacterium]|jgi:large subunit ribosomal protein L24|nr:50S ribosomal protein L24 [Kiritimatiellia bacterium]
MTQPKLHVHAGDKVLVLAGKDRGKQGKVISVNLNQQHALVEGINLIRKAVRPTEENPEGGITERETTLHTSNLKVVEAAASKEAK